MKKNLLVTLADKNHFDQAKQLFASAYFNAGWQGDYMLLIPSSNKHDPGLKWFRNKGILIKECLPFYSEKNFHINPPKFTSKSYLFTTNKIYLFTPEFKKWDNIIFIDVDIIIRASLNELTKVKSFAAVEELGLRSLSSQFIDRKNIDATSKDLLRGLGKRYNLNTSMFNTGVFVFNTQLIEEGAFDAVNRLLTEYNDIILYGEQSVLNLFFYKKWQKLSPIYNLFYLSDHWNWWHIKLKNMKGIIIHFPGPNKPWNTQNYFYKEWKNNFDKADKIDLQNIPAGHSWTEQEIINYSHYLSLRYFLFYMYYYLDNKIGQLGIFLKHYIPRLYWALKRMRGHR